MPIGSETALRAALAALFLLAVPARAHEIVAVLSSELSQYREAFESLEASLGRKVPFVVLPAQPPIRRQTRVVVAFGSKASLQPYPENVAVVYCLALGVKLADQPGVVKVNTAPSPKALLAAIERLQPKLKRLGVLWASPSFEDYWPELRSAARDKGWELALRRIESSGQLPQLLRSFGESLDALWLPPDPLLLDAASFETLKDYSAGKTMPLYTSAPGLAEKGATVSLVISFPEIGRLAAEESTKALRDWSLSERVYGDKISVAVNLPAAKIAGLEIPEDILGEVEKVLR